MVGATVILLEKQGQVESATTKIRFVLGISDTVNGLENDNNVVFQEWKT